MTCEDVARTLEELGVLYQDDEEDWAIRMDVKRYREELKRLEKKGYKRVNESCLKWQPFLFKRKIFPVRDVEDLDLGSST